MMPQDLVTWTKPHSVLLFNYIYNITLTFNCLEDLKATTHSLMEALLALGKAINKNKVQETGLSNS